MKTAQILIIGDEILSGRTKDTNSGFLCSELYKRGVRTEAIAVLPDNIVLVSQWIHTRHALSDFVFIAGGIGGTPDDITRQAVAIGAGVRLVRNEIAEKILNEYYKENINVERLNMADLPEGCELIENSVSKAPGIKIKNIYVFAGIPKILHAMFEKIAGELLGGATMHEAELKLSVGEGEIAGFMKTVNKEFPQLELGSYPTLEKDRGYRTMLVFRSLSQETVTEALARFKTLMSAL
jgi:molybdopterin-biosynthesis enzyme MoeA-like protein